MLSTLDSGTTSPTHSNTYVYYQGTSMATPNVAGVASLIKGMRPGYTQAQVLALLQSTARSFPAGSSCNTSICGTGIVDAYRALNALNVVPTAKVYLPVIIKPVPYVPPPPTNPILNPGFESGPTGWTQYSSNGFDLIFSSSVLPVSPHWWQLGSMVGWR
ncbi:MAG: S8 family serine peptidase [Chloroflexi bacterium]|nr:S8 family serine peptidase [Chloroflexota bacterium]